jgi:oligogalacturonide lyase
MPGRSLRAAIASPAVLAALALAGLAVTAGPSRAQSDGTISYEGKHVVFLVGDEEYRSEEGLPMLAKILSQRHGFKCTVLFPVNPDGTINPDNQASLAGAEALDSADAIVMLLRFRRWPDDAMKHFADAVARGVPLIGLRTSTHAFRFPKASTSEYKSFDAFGKKVMGEQWVNHWGRHKQEATRGIIEPSAKGDPILNGVSDIFGDADVYEAYPPPDAKILVRGQVLTGMKPSDPPADYRKKRTTDGQEQGINDPMMPVAWTRLNENASGGKPNKVFCTTMGAATDLQNEGLRRLVVNAVYWGLGLDVPPRADVSFVDDYRPTMYGFKGYRRGITAADHAIGKVLPEGTTAPPEEKPAPKTKAEAKAPEPKPQASDGPPTEWVEPTGHRVVRLSREPGSASLYFHQNAYTASGDKMIITTREGLSTINLKTRAIEPIVEGRAAQVVVGRKTRQVFYSRGDTVYATHLDTRATREVAKMPPGFRPGSGLAVNADETLLAGSVTEGASGDGPVSRAATPATGAEGPVQRRPGQMSLEARWAARRPMRLYTIDMQSGTVTTFHPSTDWLNHVQFSPTDPSLIMFCHEGPWHKVDRIWTIRTDGSGLRKIHTRTMDMEIAGHEFFGPDGKTIWYDLQTPKSQVFWLAGHVLATGEMIKHRVERDQWSVHFNVSPDGTLFAGDGGGPHSVAAPGNGQWIYLFTPKDGALRGERLVDLSKHDYNLEPNVTFTPDGKWLVFRSNMHGPSHVYAVEVAKAD